jgi:tRNA nucleotidyltransferase (CCA-adding enzyme)
MAYNPRTGVIDFFGGEEDLRAGVLRCVGDPNQRFQEDALRIMRAIRFAAVLGFKIEKETAKAMHENKKLLHSIASERIANELNRLIIGQGAYALLSKHTDILLEVIPEMAPMEGFKQNTPYHCYDVLEHTLRSVDYAPPDVHVRLTMLFHDIGKPECYSEKDGRGHFYGHPKVSAGMTARILSRLKYDNETKSVLKELILSHDVRGLSRKQPLKRMLGKIGEARFRQLMSVQRADAMAQAEGHRAGKLEDIDKAEQILEEVLAAQECFSLKDLAVDGRDLIDAGVAEGPELGRVLKRLLKMVIDEEVENDKEALLAAAYVNPSTL